MIDPQSKIIYKLRIQVIPSDSAGIYMAKLTNSYLLFLIIVIAGLSTRSLTNYVPTYYYNLRIHIYRSPL